jgi:hypothetical protein
VLGCVALIIGGGVAVLLASTGSPGSLAVPHVPPVRAAPSPEHGTLMPAQQDGTRVPALGLRHAGAAVRATIKVLGSSRHPVDGLTVSLSSGIDTTSCGHGCYRGLLLSAGEARGIHVSVRTAGGASTLTAFSVPRRWPISATVFFELS